ncbi:tetratricopeptide repeat protein, partial [Spirochaetota bacterium]
MDHIDADTVLTPNERSILDRAQSSYYAKKTPQRSSLIRELKQIFKRTDDTLVHAEISYLLGNLESHVGNYMSAIRHYKKAIQFDPEYYGDPRKTPTYSYISGAYRSFIPSILKRLALYLLIITFLLYVVTVDPELLKNNIYKFFGLFIAWFLFIMIFVLIKIPLIGLRVTLGSLLTIATFITLRFIYSVALKRYLRLIIFQCIWIIFAMAVLILFKALKVPDVPLGAADEPAVYVFVFIGILKNPYFWNFILYTMACIASVFILSLNSAISPGRFPVIVILTFVDIVLLLLVIYFSTFTYLQSGFMEQKSFIRYLFFGIENQAILRGLLYT